VRRGDGGPVVRTILKRNTITYDASTITRELLAQRATDDLPGELKLASMRFGESTTAATRYDTNLLSEVATVRKELTDAKKVNGLVGELICQATLLTTDGNGSIFTEAGLFTLGAGLWSANVGGSLVMFSRQTHAALAKTSAFSFDYNWTLLITT
jgi:hypothetical protein